MLLRVFAILLKTPRFAESFRLTSRRQVALETLITQTVIKTFPIRFLSGIIGYFKLCRPSSGFNNHIYSAEGHIPQYSSQGLGGASYNPLYSKYQPSNPYVGSPSNSPSFSSPYNNYYRDSSSPGLDSSSNGVRFGDDAQDLAYRSSKVSS